MGLGLYFGKTDRFTSMERRHLMELLEEFEEILTKSDELSDEEFENDDILELRGLLRKHTEKAMKLKYIWNYDLDVDNGVMGLFRFYKPKTIALSPDTYLLDVGVQKISKHCIPTIIHEFHHRHQLLTNPVWYFLRKIPGLRHMVEKKPKRLSKVARLIVNKYMKMRPEDFANDKIT